MSGVGVRWVRLALVLGLIAPSACVVVLAGRGDRGPLLAWGLLCALAAVWFLVAVGRRTSVAGVAGAPKPTTAAAPKDG